MKTLYRIHLVLGLVVSLPLLAWTTSGLWSALPSEHGGGTTYAAIEGARVRIGPADAIERARAFAGRPLPITALTLEQKDGRLEYQVIGGLDAESLVVDAESGEVRAAAPPSAKGMYFRHAHFWYFAGSWQVPLLVAFSGAAVLSTGAGLLLFAALVVRWRKAARTTAQP